MTLTLIGRWQTRLLLLFTLGNLVTLPLAQGWIGPGAGPAWFLILGYVAGLGCGWDCLYDYLQRFRWDRDWPGALQLLAGAWEGLFIGLLLRTIGLPGIPTALSLPWFVLHYSLVWLTLYLASQSLMRLLFPRWRFRGGQWW